MNLQDIFNVSAFILGGGYLVACFTVLWLIPWSKVSRVLKFVFYLGSAITLFGISLASLLGGNFLSFGTLEWGTAFLFVQLSIWAFDLNVIRERFRAIVDHDDAVGRIEEQVTQIKEQLNGDKAMHSQMIDADDTLSVRMDKISLIVENVAKEIEWVKAELRREPSIRNSLEELKASLEAKVEEGTNQIAETIEETIEENINAEASESEAKAREEGREDETND